MSNDFRDFYRNKRVMVTGHTGFKGSWLSLWLLSLGAEVIGVGNDPLNSEDNFNKLKLDEKLIDIRADIKDKIKMEEIFSEYQPDMVFHLAAQALVKTSLLKPYETIDDNVLGTLNILECIRNTRSIRSAIVVTSDKSYKNEEQIWGYKETDQLGGKDPYSASKAAVEILTKSYIDSFYLKKGIGVATVRAGNVIGGGDWSEGRIIPDAIKSYQNKEILKIRNPDSVRPWQHVLEPLSGYLLLAARLYKQPIKFSGAWNFGPDKESMITVHQLIAELKRSLDNINYEIMAEESEETSFLNLDYSKAYFYLDWRPNLKIEEALRMATEWYSSTTESDMSKLCCDQIAYYSELMFEKEKTYS